MWLELLDYFITLKKSSEAHKNKLACEANFCSFYKFWLLNKFMIFEKICAKPCNIPPLFTIRDEIFLFLQVCEKVHKQSFYL